MSEVIPGECQKVVFIAHFLQSANTQSYRLSELHDKLSPKLSSLKQQPLARNSVGQQFGLGAAGWFFRWSWLGSHSAMNSLRSVQADGLAHVS